MFQKEFNINKPIIVKSTLVYYFNNKKIPLTDSDIAMYGIEPFYKNVLEKYVDIKEIIQTDNEEDFNKIIDEAQKTFISEVKIKKTITPKEYMEKIDTFSTEEEDSFSELAKIDLIGKDNLNKQINIYKVYSNLEELLNEDIQDFEKMPFKFFIEEEKENINIFEDKVKIIIRDFYLDENGEEEIGDKTILIRKMNIFDFITLIYNSIHYFDRREELQLLYREIASKECRDFISNLVDYNKNFNRKEELQLLYNEIKEIKSKKSEDFMSKLAELKKNHNKKNNEDHKYNLSESRFKKVEDILFAIVLLNAGLLKLKKGIEISTFIKETFVENKISNNEKDYLYIKKQEYLDKNTIYLYIKTKNNKITEIKTDVLTEDKDSSIESIRKIIEKEEKKNEY